MIKNIILITIFILTNLLEVGFFKPFFTHFLFLNVAVIILFATNKNFYNQALFAAFLYGLILNILFASNLYLLPLAFVIVVFLINKISLWFGTKLIQKLIYIVICVVALNLILTSSVFNWVSTTAILIYAIIINFVLSVTKQYVDF